MGGKQHIEITGWALALYVREVERQADFGIMAGAAIGQALRQRQVEEVFRSLHALLTAAATLRRLFLPNRQASRPGAALTEREERLRDYARARGRRLRKELDVQDGVSPVTQEKLRNTIEHFDEYLDEWIFDGGQVFVDSNIGPAGMVEVEGAEARPLRHYDPESHVASVLDVQVEVASLILEMRRLKAAAQAWLTEQ